MTNLLGPVAVHEGEAVDELAELRREINNLDSRLGQLQSQYERDREQISGMVAALRALFSGNQAAVPGASAAAPPSREAWEAWKQRLPGAADKVIDALLVQPATATQLIALTKSSYSTVQRALAVLKANGLIEKDGERIRLKRI